MRTKSLSAKSRKRRRGSALVEGAFVFLGTLLMILTALDFAQLMMFMQLFPERARWASRTAVVSSYDTATVKNLVVYNSTTAPADAETPGWFGLKPSMVAVTRQDTGTLNDRIEVSISQYPLKFFTPFLAGSVSHRPFKSVTPVESMGAAD